MNPKIGRFMQYDTYDGAMGMPVTLNHYLYGNANPTMFTDPSGHVGVLSLNSSIALQGIIAAFSANVIAKAIEIAYYAITEAVTEAFNYFDQAVISVGSQVYAPEQTGSLSDLYLRMRLIELYSKRVATASQAPIMPPVQVYGKTMPAHRLHIMDSMLGVREINKNQEITAGKLPTSFFLTRGPRPQKEDRAFLQNSPACGRYANRPAGRSVCDEYPYNSTHQGGDINWFFGLGVVSTRLVPSWESAKQGGFISAFYTQNGIVASANILYENSFYVLPVGYYTGYYDRKWMFRKVPQVQ